MFGLVLQRPRPELLHVLSLLGLETTRDVRSQVSASEGTTLQFAAQFSSTNGDLSQGPTSHVNPNVVTDPSSISTH